MGKVVRLDKFSDELKKYSQKSIKVYKQTVIETLADNISYLVANSPVDTGLFAQSWSMEVTEKEAVIGNFAPHAPIIEFGARPFTPPIGPLLEWARRVLKQPEINDHCWALATYTQNKISEEGMEPKNILGDALDKITGEIRDKLKQRLGKV